MPAFRPAVAAVSCLFGLCASSITLGASFDFRAARNFPALDAPIWVEAGDLNEDGAPDVVVASGTTAALAILMGDGTGRFAEPRPLPLLQVPRSILVTDLDGDQHLDLVIGNTDPGSFISVLPGDGLGGFGAERRFPAGGIAEFAAAADFTGDGRIDLVVTNRDDSRVALLAGDALGGFALPVTHATAATPQEIVAADVNQDGRPDAILVCAGGGSVSALLALGGGVFAPAINSLLGTTVPRSLAVVDVNQDGLLDVVAGSPGDRDLSYRIGDGRGAFTSFKTLNLPAVAPAVRAGDFDRDGRPEVAAVQGAISLFPDVALVHPASTNPRPIWRFAAAGAGAVHLAIEDFDRDGDLDLVTANMGGDDVSFLAGDGGGGLPESIRLFIPQNPVDMTATDFNRDGNPDLAVVNYLEPSPGSTDCGDAASMLVTLYLGNGMARMSHPAISHHVGCRPQAVVAADFNHDGFPDLAVGNSGTNSIIPTLTVLLGDGAGGMTSAPTLPALSPPTSLAAGDFDGDGNTDLAAALSNGLIHLHRGDGTGRFPEEGTVVVPSIPRSLQAADMNQDGRLDLVAALPGANSVVLLFGDGTFGGFSRSTIPVGPGPQSVRLADLNEDGDLDIATADTGGPPNPEGRTVSLLLSDGPGVFRPATAIETGLGPRDLEVADFDLDRHLDLAILGDVKSVLIHGADGTGNFARAPRFGTGAGPIRVQSTDFNLDGLPDLAVLNRAERSVSLLLNRVAKASRLDLLMDQGAFSWVGMEGAIAYDVVRGDLKTLVQGRGDFTAAVRECLADDSPSTEHPFTPVPERGEGDWIVVRPITAPGPGSYDSGGPAQVGSRDPGINVSPMACP